MSMKIGLQTWSQLQKHPHKATENWEKTEMFNKEKSVCKGVETFRASLSEVSVLIDRIRVSRVNKIWLISLLERAVERQVHYTQEN